MEQSYDQEEVKKAFDAIKAAMIADCPEEPGSYAHSWHCNLAMCFYDELMNGKSNDADIICNAAASRFMKMCFDVDTKA